MRRTSLLFALTCLVLLCAQPVLADEKAEALNACGRGDFPAALRILGPLAEQGNANAQFNLGCIYIYGCKGTPADIVRGYSWIFLAAAQGYERAQEALDNYTVFFPQITTDQIAKAKQMARDWKPKAAQQP